MSCLPWVSGRHQGQAIPEWGVPVAEGSIYSDEAQLLCDLREDRDIARRACAVLYRMYYKELVQQLQKSQRIAKFEDIEDAVQMVFVELAAGQLKYDGTGSLLAYLMTCARHRLTKLLRSEQSHQARVLAIGLGDSNPSHQDDPHAVAERGEHHDILYSAMQKLPSDQRQIVEMVFFEDSRHSEVANVMKINRKTVCRRSLGALKTLARLLEN